MRERERNALGGGTGCMPLVCDDVACAPSCFHVTTCEGAIRELVLNVCIY